MTFWLMLYQGRFEPSDVSTAYQLISHHAPSFDTGFENWWRRGFELTVNPLFAARSATRYNRYMIRSFRHKGVERFFKSGSRSGIQAAHAPRLARQLSALHAATRPEDMNRPGWDWHALKGGRYGHWSVSVNGNWRLTFAFENGDAILVDYQDYH